MQCKVCVVDWLITFEQGEKNIEQVLDMDTAKQIATFIRWREWGPGKLTLLWVVCVYLGITYEISFDDFASTFVIFFCFAIAQAALGYVLNDWGDRDLDRRQFKRNAFNGKTRLESILALLLILIMAMVSGAPLLLRRGFGLLWATWAVTAAIYSLYPLRLKTRGLVGLVVVAVAQWMLPVMIAFAAFEVAGGADMWVLALGLTFSGMVWELGHQRFNRDRNRMTRTGTFAADLEQDKLNRTYALALVGDKLAVMVVAMVFLLALGISWSNWVLGIGLVLACAYLFFLGFALRDLWNSYRQGGCDDPYYGGGHSHQASFQALNNVLLTFILPGALGGVATLRSPLYALVLGFYLVWRIGVVGAKPLKHWPFLWIIASRAGRSRRR